MIVAISTSFADVSIDDEIEGYCPTRTAELVRHVGALYREALAANAEHFTVVVVDGDDDAVE